MSEETKEAPTGKSVVGYRQPPVEHRFQKGRSGNPRGRPRKDKKAGERPADPVLTHHLADLVLAEAIRPIQVRENDEIIELPLIQAVVRSLGVAAVKGSHRAQIAITGMVKSVQDKILDDRGMLYKAAIEYKDSWEEVFKACDDRGEPRPEPVPHPHEIRLNTRTMEVIYNGPETPDDKAKWDKMLARQQDAIQEIAYLQKLKKRKAWADQIKLLDDDIRREQRIVDLVSDLIPDEKTRREPDFDLRDWRGRRREWRKIKDDLRKRRPAD